MTTTEERLKQYEARLVEARQQYEALAVMVRQLEGVVLALREELEMQGQASAAPDSPAD